MRSNFLKMMALGAVLSSSMALCPTLKSAADANQINKGQFRVVRSICGSGGTQRGDHFVIDDQRSVFYVPEGCYSPAYQFQRKVSLNFALLMSHFC